MSETKIAVSLGMARVIATAQGIFIGICAVRLLPFMAWYLLFAVAAIVFILTMILDREIFVRATPGAHLVVYRIERPTRRGQK